MRRRNTQISCRQAKRMLFESELLYFQRAHSRSIHDWISRKKTMYLISQNSNNKTKRIFLSRAILYYERTHRYACKRFIYAFKKYRKIERLGHRIPFGGIFEKSVYIRLMYTNVFKHQNSPSRQLSTIFCNDSNKIASERQIKKAFHEAQLEIDNILNKASDMLETTERCNHLKRDSWNYRIVALTFVFTVISCVKGSAAERAILGIFEKILGLS